MIAMLKGRVESIKDGNVVVDVGGVGYLVFCPAGTIGQMTVGEAVTLYIETHVREDHIHLYGFIDPLEREWYQLLTTVQGVGSKVAIAMLSSLSLDELSRAIVSGDKAQIGRANGVGPKLAARIATELKDKVAKIALGTGGSTGSVGTPPGSKSKTTDASSAPNVSGDMTRDAVSALVNLGYSPSDAFSAVSHAANRAGEGVNIEALVKGGLAELGPKEHGR
ncbi:MAG: Holliday junction branch migration protein RuvA [Rhodospirillaceae bacterium]|nr:Holliday junction branch migration protein RuvA [Rhodospirillaceae bacterium]